MAWLITKPITIPNVIAYKWGWKNKHQINQSIKKIVSQINQSIKKRVLIISNNWIYKQAL